MRIEQLDPIYARTEALRESVLRELAIRPDSKLAMFFALNEGPFNSSRTGFTLLDIQEADASLGSIFTSTLQARQSVGWPNGLLVLTDTIANGVYAYECSTEAVFSIDFEGSVELFLAGHLAPEYSSFGEFTSWYFERDA